MDGVISFPVMVASYFFLPDLPDTAASRRIFSEEVSSTSSPTSISFSHHQSL